MNDEVKITRMFQIFAGKLKTQAGNRIECIIDDSIEQFRREMDFSRKRQSYHTSISEKLHKSLYSPEYTKCGVKPNAYCDNPECGYKDLFLKEEAARTHWSNQCEEHRRNYNRAANTLVDLGYTDVGGSRWKPPLGRPKPTPQRGICGSCCQSDCRHPSYHVCKEITELNRRLANQADNIRLDGKNILSKIEEIKSLEKEIEDLKATNKKLEYDIRWYKDALKNEEAMSAAARKVAQERGDRNCLLNEEVKELKVKLEKQSKELGIFEKCVMSNTLWKIAAKLPSTVRELVYYYANHPDELN